MLLRAQALLLHCRRQGCHPSWWGSALCCFELSSQLLDEIGGVFVVFPAVLPHVSVMDIFDCGIPLLLFKLLELIVLLQARTDIWALGRVG